MKPPLYDQVNKLYHLATDFLPKNVREGEMTNAFILGAVGSYGIARALQGISRHLIRHAVPRFDRYVLPALEVICIAGVTLGPLVGAHIDPEAAKELLAQHPVYTAGMAGIISGGVGAAALDLQTRRVRHTVAQLCEKK